MSKPAVPQALFNLTTQAEADEPHPAGRLIDYALLLKPRVMGLVLFTAVVGLVLAPGGIDLARGLIAIACIALGAGAAGAINMWYDRDIDSQMTRTMDRPLPAGRLAPASALWLGVALAAISVITMSVLINGVAALLLIVTIAIYVFIYTIWLKRRTPQNIVIGGASGALPPMIGWAAVSGDVSLNSAILFLIIFIWTPPHFWALALFCSDDYENAGVPMLPVVVGTKNTKNQILAYSLLLAPITVLPAFTGMASPVAGLGLALLAIWFVVHAFRVRKDEGVGTARAMFRFSLMHLFGIFVILLLDRGISALFQ